METKVHVESAETEPGFPPEFYSGIIRGLPHSAYLKGPGLSRSSLDNLRKTPHHFRALHIDPVPEWLIDDEDHVDTSSATFAGTLCHSATFEPATFDELYVVGPKVDKRSKDWKDFVKSCGTRIPITERQKHVAFAQAASIRAVPDAAEILEGGECEVSAYAIDPETGVLMRARADCANRNFGTPDAPAAMLLDAKTTDDLSDEALERTVWKWGYHYQDAWYSNVFALAAGMPVAGFLFAFVEKSYPFACRTFELDATAKAIARRENRNALDLYASCVQNRSWPGYPQATGKLSLPYWALRGEL